MPYGDPTARERALRANFGGGPVTPGTLYVALLSAEPGDDAPLGVEPDLTGGYARVAFTNDAAAWTIATAAEVSTATNAAELRWPVTTGTYSIATALNQWALYDNATGGVLIAYGPLTETITVTGAGDVPVIVAGDLVLTQAA